MIRGLIARINGGVTNNANSYITLCGEILD